MNLFLLTPDDLNTLNELNSSNPEKSEKQLTAVPLDSGNYVLNTDILNDVIYWQHYIPFLQTLSTITISLTDLQSY